MWSRGRDLQLTLSFPGDKVTPSTTNTLRADRTLTHPLIEPTLQRATLRDPALHERSIRIHSPDPTCSATPIQSHASAGKSHYGSRGGRRRPACAAADFGATRAWNEHGRRTSESHLVSQSNRFGLSEAEARKEIRHVASVVRKWRDRFAATGVSRKDIEYIAPAMLSSSFLNEEPPQAAS
jgi:hypothetical protein